MSSYWNPEDQLGRTFNDQQIYGKRYYDWTLTDKYRRNTIFPTNQMGYPRNRLEIQFYQRPELANGGAMLIHKRWRNQDKADLNYLSGVYPPTYYEMWS